MVGNAWTVPYCSFFSDGSSSSGLFFSGKAWWGKFSFQVLASKKQCFRKWVKWYNGWEESEHSFHASLCWGQVHSYPWFRCDSGTYQYSAMVSILGTWVRRHLGINGYAGYSLWQGWSMGHHTVQIFLFFSFLKQNVSKWTHKLLCLDLSCTLDSTWVPPPDFDLTHDCELTHPSLFWGGEEVCF